MAKDSPYFKFYVSEYNDGDIQLCSMEAQGLFTNLCSLYWSREGNLFLSKAKKLFAVRDKVWSQLINERIIKIQDDKIIINFLDEQLEERSTISSKNTENGKRGGRPKKPTAFISVSETKANESNIEEKREEKRREEEKREENARDLVWFENQTDDIFIERMKINHKGKDIQKAIRDSFAHLAADPVRLANSDSVDVKKLINSWLINQKPISQQNGTNKKQQHTDSLIIEHAKRWGSVATEGTQV